MNFRSCDARHWMEHCFLPLRLPDTSGLSGMRAPSGNGSFTQGSWSTSAEYLRSGDSIFEGVVKRLFVFILAPLVLSYSESLSPFTRNAALCLHKAELVDTFSILWVQKKNRIGQEGAATVYQARSTLPLDKTGGPPYLSRLFLRVAKSRMSDIVLPFPVSK